MNSDKYVNEFKSFVKKKEFRMKKINFLFVVAIIIVLASCASTKVESLSQVDKDANNVEILNWFNRNLDVPAKPEWLKKLVCGNVEYFRNEFSIDKDKIIKYSVGTARTRDASLVASRVNYNAIRAEELKTKVVSEAAATLNDEGYTEATSNAATLAKVDISGHELVTQFWQQVKTTDKETDTSRTEFICYSVYQISKQDWANTLKAFMQQIIPAIPDSKAQMKMAQTIQSLYDDTTAERERSEAETKAALQAQIKLAEIDAAKTAAVAGANAMGQTKEKSNWMDALDLACSVLF